MNEENPNAKENIFGEDLNVANVPEFQNAQEMQVVENKVGENEAEPKPELNFKNYFDQIRLKERVDNSLVVEKNEGKRKKKVVAPQTHHNLRNRKQVQNKENAVEEVKESTEALQRKSTRHMPQKEKKEEQKMQIEMNAEKSIESEKNEKNEKNEKIEQENLEQIEKNLSNCIENGKSEQESAEPLKEIIISPNEGPKTTFYCIRESGGTIGRHSSNNILILDEGVSRFHAQITYSDNAFFLQDIGSTTGTFIKVKTKLQLAQGDIIELGSNQFFIKQLSVEPPFPKISLCILEGPNQFASYELALSSTVKFFSFGRRTTNSVSFPEDLHLSNVHANIYVVQNKFILEDMSSTNGYSFLSLLSHLP